MISGKSLSKPRFQLIDGSNIGNHTYLEGSDKCFFLYEYTSNTNYSFSDTNSLISNLKKPPSKKRTSPKEFSYKTEAIERCSAEIAQGLNPAWLVDATLVPIPPSKTTEDPEYDDRMLQVCDGVSMITQFNIDVRELVTQNQPIRAAHVSNPGNRPSIDEIANNYVIAENIANPEPTRIGIVDDVLTTGSHFKAMQRALWNRFSNVSICGIFIARRVFLNDEHEFSDSVEF